MTSPAQTPDGNPITKAQPTITPTIEAMAIAEPTPTTIPTLILAPAEVEFASDIVDFVLQDLTIEVGAGVIWTNLDISSHTTTSGKPGGITGTWDSGTLSTGRSFSFTFNRIGTFPYFCTIHPFMQATITVAESLPGGPMVSAPAPSATPTHRAMVMVEPTVTPAPEGIAKTEVTPTRTPGVSAQEPTPEVTRQRPDVQEFAIIENYAATRFFPKEIVVLRDVPVKLYLTRLPREHVNRFTISPFFSSSEVILPGEVGLIEFLPDEPGVFKIRNVGHGFEATLVVVDTMEDVRKHFVDKGVKMFALIQSVDDSRVFPDESFVIKDVPVKVFNISLKAEHEVSIAPFYVAEDINVRPREITSFEFTPDSTGAFTISNETNQLTATLIVEEGG